MKKEIERTKLKEKGKSGQLKSEVPVFNLDAFSKKANWSDFYIQNLPEHIAEHTFVGQPHAHDFYLVLLVSKGGGNHVVDFIDYPIKPGTLFLLTPGQVHTWTLSKDIRGFVIFFTRKFYQLHLSKESLLEFPFYHSLSASPVIQLGKDDVVKFVVQKMYQEYTCATEVNLRMLRAYLDLLLLEAARHYDDAKKVKAQGNTFKIRRLEQLIDSNFRTLRQPSDYAELMNLAPGYLNSICKISLGKTLTQLIQERVLLEAKRMFVYSELNVNEVAAKLNFEDPSYFVRWFKKQSRTTPEEFRKSIS